MRIPWVPVGLGLFLTIAVVAVVANPGMPLAGLLGLAACGALSLVWLD